LLAELLGRLLGQFVELSLGVFAGLGIVALHFFTQRLKSVQRALRILVVRTCGFTALAPVVLLVSLGHAASVVFGVTGLVLTFVRCCLALIVAFFLWRARLGVIWRVPLVLVLFLACVFAVWRPLDRALRIIPWLVLALLEDDGDAIPFFQIGQLAFFAVELNLGVVI